MPYYDEIFKHVTTEFPHPLAVLALKTEEVKVGKRLSTEHTTVRMHHSDMTFHIHLPDEEAILHIEAQTDDSTHKPMPLRMLAYSSFLALEHEKNVYSTVLYFRPPAGQRDPGFYSYGNAQRGGGWFQYNVIRIYELEGEAYLDPGAVGLLPFTALMKPPAEMTPQAWVEKCIETTQVADVDREMRATLLFALSVFGSLAHPPEFFQDPLLEAIMRESPFYEQVIQRGIEQGARQMSIENTLAILEARFPGTDVNTLRPRLEAIADLNQLKQVNLSASLATSFHDFQEALEA
jgi:predicted transposase YdaD